MPVEYVSSSAGFSYDGRHRLWLIRTWAETDSLQTVAFVGLNPSSAGAEQDDPTIRRCVRFARDWGFGGMVMVNLFTQVATDPRALGEHGPQQLAIADSYLESAAAGSTLTVAAWGAHPAAEQRSRVVVRSRVLGSFSVLGLTKSGAPRHPLYMPASAVPLDRQTLEPVPTPEEGSDHV